MVCLICRVDGGIFCFTDDCEELSCRSCPEQRAKKWSSSQLKHKTQHLDMNSIVTVCMKQWLVLSLFCDKSLLWWLTYLRFMFLCFYSRVAKFQLLLFPQAQDSFARLNFKYMNFPAKIQIVCQLQITHYDSPRTSKGKEWKNGREENKTWSKSGSLWMACHLRWDWTEQR